MRSLGTPTALDTHHPQVLRDPRTPRGHMRRARHAAGPSQALLEVGRWSGDPCPLGTFSLSGSVSLACSCRLISAMVLGPFLSALEEKP